MRLFTFITLLAFAALSAGCGTGTSYYRPRAAAPTELTPRYDDRLELWADGKRVARGHTYEGLEDFVRCVPEARRHAREASSAGRAAKTASTVAGFLAIGGLAGLSGLAVEDKGTQAALLVGGVVVEVVGLVLAAGGAGAKVEADGHAVDAMNYYNDGAGSIGRACSR